jgi:hypothetical protein
VSQDFVTSLCTERTKHLTKTALSKFQSKFRSQALDPSNLGARARVGRTPRRQAGLWCRDPPTSGLSSSQCHVPGFFPNKVVISWDRQGSYVQALGVNKFWVWTGICLCGLRIRVRKHWEKSKEDTTAGREPDKTDCTAEQRLTPTKTPPVKEKDNWVRDLKLALARRFTSDFCFGHERARNRSSRCHRQKSDTG